MAKSTKPRAAKPAPIPDVEAHVAALNRAQAEVLGERGTKADPFAGLGDSWGFVPSPPSTRGLLPDEAAARYLDAFLHIVLHHDLTTPDAIRVRQAQADLRAAESARLESLDTDGPGDPPEPTLAERVAAILDEPALALAIHAVIQSGKARIAMPWTGRARKVRRDPADTHDMGEVFPMDGPLFGARVANYTMPKMAFEAEARAWVDGVLTSTGVRLG